MFCNQSNADYSNKRTSKVGDWFWRFHNELSKQVYPCMVNTDQQQQHWRNNEHRARSLNVELGWIISVPNEIFDNGKEIIAMRWSIKLGRSWPCMIKKKDSATIFFFNAFQAVDNISNAILAWPVRNPTALLMHSLLRLQVNFGHERSWNRIMLASSSSGTSYWVRNARD